MLVLCLLLVAFLSVLGFALLELTNSFQLRVRLRGEELRARALAEGGAVLAFARLEEIQSLPEGGRKVEGTVRYADGSEGRYEAAVEGSAGLIKALGATAGVSQTVFLRFERR